MFLRVIIPLHAFVVGKNWAVILRSLFSEQNSPQVAANFTLNASSRILSGVTSLDVKFTVMCRAKNYVQVGQNSCLHHSGRPRCNLRHSSEQLIKIVQKVFEFRAQLCAPRFRGSNALRLPLVWILSRSFWTTQAKICRTRSAINCPAKFCPS